MEILCLGLNHHTAPVEVRERYAVSGTQQGTVSKEMTSIRGVNEVVVLSTCNRTEVYAVAEDLEQAAEELKSHLGGGKGVKKGDEEHFYLRYSRAAVEHLCRVVSGLDSMVLGETEIFGQVKQAYQQALSTAATGGILNPLFQKSFGIGKKVRTQTTIQVGQTSVGSVAVDLAEKIFGHLKSSKVMIIGAGEMSRVTALRLLERGAKSMFVTNRSYQRAQDLAKEMGGEAIRFDDWEKSLVEVDVVVSSTGAPKAVVHAEQIERVRRKRKYRPLFFIDIAVPRDVDPAVGEIEEVYLYDLDALQKLAEEGKHQRKKQVEVCQSIIETEVESLLERQRSKL